MSQNQMSAGAGRRDAFDSIKTRGSVSSVIVSVLAVVGVGGIVIALLSPAMRVSRPAGLRTACMNNLKQIALGLQLYAEKHHALPPAYTTDAHGKPLHSWRTLILPFIEEGELYKSIDLTKPWDDPANAEAFKKVVPVYQCPGSGYEDNRTIYLAIVAPESCIQATESRRLADITDQQLQTLMLIEADLDQAVPWMSPVDASEADVIGLSQKTKLVHPGGVNAAFVDGHVQFINCNLPADQLRALISIAGNDDALANGAE